MAMAQRYGDLPPPYSPLETMRPMTDLETGRPISTFELDQKGEGSWGDRFYKLVQSRLNGTNFKTPQKGSKFFDKVVCIGMMKSGTTSVGVAMKRLSLKHLGRWTGPMGKANKMDEWYLHPDSWKQFYGDIHTRISGGEGFEDFPWPFMYRRFQDLTGNSRVGYVLTLRNCRAHAESATAYNNRNKEGQNTARWISDHCDRVHRRCHVHQLDIWNYFAHERPGMFMDDFLLVEMTSSKSQENWERFRDFTLGGGQYAYRSAGAPSLTAASHAAMSSKDVLKTKEMPRVNTRPKWQTDGGKTYCKDSDFTTYNHTVSGQLLMDLPPHPVSTFCDRTQFKDKPACQKKIKLILDYYDNKPPPGTLPPGITKSRGNKGRG